MRIPRLRSTMLGLAASLAAGLAMLAAPAYAAGPTPIYLGEHRMTATANTVLVNRYGGITVSGTMDCTQAVTDALAAAQADAGAGYVVHLTGDFVGPNWSAIQYAGRRAITGSYASGIARQCADGPLPWTTLYAYPVGATQWVYSTDGKFRTGAIHIEMDAEGELDLEAYAVGDVTKTAVKSYYMDVYGFSGWDLRAVQVK